MQEAPTVSVLLVSYNTRHLLADCLGALRRAATNVPTQIIVVENASRDGSREALEREHPDVELIVNETNVGFGRANNQALERARGRYVLLLNTDAFVEPDTLERTVAFMEAHADVGVLGVRLTGRDGALQPSCRYFPNPLNTFVARAGLGRGGGPLRMVDDLAWSHDTVRDCDWVPGCYYLVRRRVVVEAGLFDPRFFLYMEEVDHCRRVKALGWRVVYFPDARVVHLGGESAKADGEVTTHGLQSAPLQVESELLYYRKTYGLAGVGAHLALTTIGDAILATKHVLRGRPLAALPSFVAHTRLALTLAQRTALGARPTR